MTADTVLFDLDGTLVDSAAGFAMAANAALEKNGRPPYPPESLREMVSEGVRTVILNAWDQQLSPDEVERIRDDYIAAYAADPGYGSAVFPGISAWLASAHQAGIRLGIVTNKALPLARAIADIMGLSPYMSVLICPELIGNINKPQPDGILLAMEKLGATAERTIYCGDHAKDIAAANAAGTRSIACGYGFFPDHEDFRQWPATWHAGDSETMVRQLSEACGIHQGD